MSHNPTGAPSAHRTGVAVRRRSATRWPRRLFVLPAALFLAIFAVVPLIQLVRIATSDVTVTTLVRGDWEFVGIQNFINVVTDPGFAAILSNTVLFVGIVSVVGLLGGLTSAIALMRSGAWSGFVLAVLVFVWALPPVVNGSVWKFLLGSSGLFNSALLNSGLAADPIPFLYDDRFALISVAMVNAWAVVPFNTLVFRAAMIGIPIEQFEAARIDGARRWQEIWYIVLPSVRPTALVLAVLTIVYGFRSFDYIYVMTFGGPGVATTTLPFSGYVQAFTRLDFGKGAATALLVVVMVLVLAIVYARSVRKEETQ